MRNVNCNSALFLIMFLLMFTIGCTSQPEIDYLGLEPPGITPSVFKPEILRNYEHMQSPIFSPDGRSLFITLITPPRQFSTFFIKKENNRWAKPYIPELIEKYKIRYPFVSPDGKKLFFVIVESHEKGGKTIYNSDIWASDIVSTGVWGEPYNLGPIINSEYHERAPSVTSDGTLYFYSDRDGGKGGLDIYLSTLKEGIFTEPQNLGRKVNSENNEGNPFIAPDESYILFNSNERPDSYGSHDIYISFRKKDRTWTEAKNVGDIVNSSASDAKPYVSPDGKYFFFSSSRNGNWEIFWVDAKIIEDLKPKELKKGKKP